ncbi:hypothetical protein V5E97_25170 [Singulisphaera sp. Ch08]|uniref:Uncharacterized protein n=1 Tax=Singulisphaera sp. Ch08 TaxID=3120278 RepID=A0AAU7C8Q0_9BACT
MEDIPDELEEAIGMLIGMEVIAGAIIAGVDIIMDELPVDIDMPIDMPIDMLIDMPDIIARPSRVSTEMDARLLCRGVPERQPSLV